MVSIAPSRKKVGDGKVTVSISHRKRHTDMTSTQQITIRNPRHPTAGELKEMDCAISRLNRLIKLREQSGIKFTPDDIINDYNNLMTRGSLFNFMSQIITELKTGGRLRTAETYTSALNSFRKFRNDENLMLDALDSSILQQFEDWHKSRGLSPNTISFYNRILRAVYNRAVDIGLTENRHPFRKVYTGIGKTRKRALPIATIRNLINLNLSYSPLMDHARNIFLLSFMLRGMSFIDMAYLRKNDLRNGVITYRRRKTGKTLNIAWTSEMQDIIDKYPRNDSQFLLPILTSSKGELRNKCRNSNYNINRSLKEIAKILGLQIPLTLYVARHSWASAAKQIGIPIRIISEAMGHNSETTTQIYLTDLDTSEVDRANEKILKNLKPLKNNKILKK